MTAVEFLQEQRKSFFEATEMVIRGIKPEMFDISPGESLMTFGEQIDHISAIEADLLGETSEALKKEKIAYGYKPSTELSDAVSQWRRVHGLSDEFIAGLSDDNLEFRFLTVSHAHVSVAMMINSVLEHELHHRGELLAYFKTLNVAPPRKWSE